MTLPHEVTLSREASFQQGDGKEEARAERQDYLAAVVGNGWVIAICCARQDPVDDGNACPKKDNQRRYHLARLLRQSRLVVGTIFAVAARKQRQTGQT